MKAAAGIGNNSGIRNSSRIANCIGGVRIISKTSSPMMPHKYFCGNNEWLGYRRSYAVMARDTESPLGITESLGSGISSQKWIASRTSQEFM
ncbi:hypothetical protein [Paracoccus alkanivorans]|uniref:hypothetical protein n=1 Tax=Paracoccus alkanivorans TaxID=2116655 RepID=UPI00140AFC49|nr:hypothetical protein [Paracoccus alkanivorans]